MTETEMRIVREILWQCGEALAVFDERIEDKKLLFATADEPTMLRYIIASPAFTEKQKEHAKDTLDYLMDEEAEGSLSPAPFQVAQPLFEVEGEVLYCAPNEEA